MGLSARGPNQPTNAAGRSCYDRSKSNLGSTTLLDDDFSFGGVVSDDPQVNPLMASANIH